jgi:virginiamycin B lyase
MRIGFAALFLLGTSLVFPMAAQTSIAPAKPSKVTASNTKSRASAETILPPKDGVKTPGVQIAGSTLKFEQEIPFAAPWVLAADSILVANTAKDSIERFDSKTFKAGDPITGVSKPCGGAVSAFKDLWVISCADQALLRLDSKTGKLITKIPTGVSPVTGVLAASADSIWILSDGRTTLSRIDPAENKIVAEIRLPAGCGSLTSGESALWVACPNEDRVFKIDPLTNLVDKRIETAAQPIAVALGENAIWVLSKKEGKVERVDLKTFKVIKTLELGVANTLSGIAIGQGSVWVTGTGFPLTRIDPLLEKERVAQQFWGPGGGAISFLVNSLWLSNTKENTLWRIDPKRVLATLAD